MVFCKEYEFWVLFAGTQWKVIAQEAETIQLERGSQSVSVLIDHVVYLGKA